jgi:hypothetical protein
MAIVVVLHLALEDESPRVVALEARALWPVRLVEEALS